jgi:hypothetical protein
MTWTGSHNDVPLGNIHIPYNFEYADAAARTAATGFVAADVGKFARQDDDNTIWMLLNDVTPTWVQVGSGVALASVAESGTGTDNTKAVTPAGLFPAKVDVASGSTTDIGAAASILVRITGTTTITAFDTAPDGIRRVGYFAGALTLTHNSTSLILPGGANITTAAGDSFEAISLGSGNWKVLFYQKADGTAIVGGGGGGGALVLLEQHTASASASLDFTTAISSTYDDYLIEILDLIPATDGDNLFLRFNTGGGFDNTSGHYGWNGLRWDNSGTGSAGSGSDTKIECDGGGAISNNSSYGLTGTIKLHAPGNSIYKKCEMDTTFRNTSGNQIGNQGRGIYLVTSAITQFQLIFSTGNIASGIGRCYGIAKT